MQMHFPSGLMNISYYFPSCHWVRVRAYTTRTLYLTPDRSSLYSHNKPIYCVVRCGDTKCPTHGCLCQYREYTLYSERIIFNGYQLAFVVFGTANGFLHEQEYIKKNNIKTSNDIMNKFRLLRRNHLSNTKHHNLSLPLLLVSNILDCKLWFVFGFYFLHSCHACIFETCRQRQNVSCIFCICGCGCAWSHHKDSSKRSLIKWKCFNGTENCRRVYLCVGQIEERRILY